MKRYLVLLCCGIIFLLAAACSTQSTNDPGAADTEDTIVEISSEDPDNPNYGHDFTDTNLQTIYLAGGCFWGVEAFFEQIIGVYDATSGYANGDGEDPTYGEVIKGDQGFVETVEIIYDNGQVKLDELLDYYFMVIDPTSVNKQGNDVGIQYRTGIYYENKADQPAITERVAQEQEKYDEPIATEIEPLHNYFLAEEAHQDYLAKNPNGYCHIDMNVLDDIQD